MGLKLVYTDEHSARHVSTLFPGSVLLHHESEGHASYSNPSLCTAHILRSYFQTSSLPAKDTICNPVTKPFIGCLDRDEDGECRKLTEEDEEIWKAMVAITEVWP
jgi:hypothetical protein